MRKIIPILALILMSREIIAQDRLYSEKTIISMWNGNISDWVPVLEKNDTVTFSLTKDHSTLLMYSKGSGMHFKKFISNTEYLQSEDTTFYRIVSSEVVKDIDGNPTYKFSARAGLQNKEYQINYYKNANLLHVIFEDNTGRVVRNRFIIKTGSIK